LIVSGDFSCGFGEQEMDLQTRRSAQHEGSHEHGHGADGVVGDQVEGEEAAGNVHGQILCRLRGRGYDIDGIRPFSYHSLRHDEGEYAGGCCFCHSVPSLSFR